MSSTTADLVASRAKPLAGKVALVTGSSRGIGASIARHLAADGARVVINYVKAKTAADALVADIEAGAGKGAAVAVQADVGVAADAKRLVAETLAAFGGRLDIVVNNAGVFRAAPLGQISEAHVAELFQTNIASALWVTQEAAPHLPTDGTGRVINISSGASRSGGQGAAVYAATKAALDVISRSFALELAERRISVLSVAPGLTKTDIIADAPPGMVQSIEAKIPVKRAATSDEIGAAVAGLAGPASSYLTGETVFVTGGLL